MSYGDDSGYGGGGRFPLGRLIGVLMIAAGLIVGWRKAAKEQIGRLRMARVFVALAVVFLAIAASPLLFGPWKLQIGPLRLLSVGTPHKPLSLAVACLIIFGAMHPSVRTAWQRRSAMTFYALAALASCKMGSDAKANKYLAKLPSGARQPIKDMCEQIRQLDEMNSGSP